MIRQPAVCRPPAVRHHRGVRALAALTHQDLLLYIRGMTSTARAKPSVPLADRAQLFHALSDETRLAILEMLRAGERCVCDLQDALDAAQSRLSFHLKVLKDAGWVRDRKEGRWSYYTLVPDRVAELESYGRHLATRRAAGHTPVLLQLTRSPSAAPSKVVSGSGRAGKAIDPGDCCG
jgi:ArsR family transcriptional regulator